MLREAYTRVPRTASVVGPAHDEALAPTRHPPSSQVPELLAASPLFDAPVHPSHALDRLEREGITSSSRTRRANLGAGGLPVGGGGGWGRFAMLGWEFE
ncbi:hypothetical protein SF12_05890 [Streptomyces sp. MBRL 601]|nr:hypothetical protein SF12_05890 [Streptomyces sp. MBRL 601]